MKKYIKYIKNNWKATIVAPFLMMLDAVGSIIQPLLAAKIIDVGIATGDIDYIIKMGLLMIGFSFLVMLCGFGCMYFSSKAAYGFAYNLREDLIKKIQEFSFSNINKFKTSSLVTRLTNDVTIISNLFQMMLRIVVRAPFMFIGGIVMVLFISKRLTLLLVILIPILTLIVLFVLKKTAPLFNKVQIAIDKVNATIRESLKGIRVIKSFVREDYQKQKFEKVNKNLQEVSINSFGKIIIMGPLISLIMNVSVALVLWFGAKEALNGYLEVGALTSFISYIMMVLSSLIMMSMVFMNFARAKASSDRILEVLEEKPDITSENGIKEKTKVEKITFNVNSFTFKEASSPSLKDIKFEVKKGDRVAIIGSTGCGKSTLVNLIPRFYDVDDGEILINDINIKEFDLNNLRNLIGMVLQENRLFKGTIKENILWGKKDASMEELKHALEVAQIDDYVLSLEDKYDSIVEQRGSNFSGGQKQRLCIARALIKKPQILILDDSVSALDATTEANLTNALNKEFKKMIVFTVTQRISSCKNADYIIVMENGTITDIGTHEELLKKSKVYKEINNSQQEVLQDA